MLLGIWRNRNVFAGQEGFDPFRRPGLPGIFVDPGERLEGYGLFRVFRERAAEIMKVVAHGKRRGPDRPAESKEKICAPT